MRAGLTVDISSPGAPRALEEEWRGLEKAAEPSFFQSWTWIGTWLESLQSPPLLLRLRDAAGLAGLGLIVPRRVRRHGLVVSRQWHLNAWGDGDLDRLAIEYNGLLLRRDLGSEALSAVFRVLRERDDWDEWVLPGVPPSYVQAGQAAGLACVCDHAAPCFVIALDRLRGQADGLIGMLSANSRAQLRRALKMAEESGPLALTPARTVQEAQDFFAQMRALDRRAQAGAFATPARVDFHRRLIERALPRGELEILAASAGKTVFGFLYHFIYEGRVLAYQAAYRAGVDNRHRPGLVMHHLAIARAAARGDQVYDFLAGEARYKRSLGVPGESLLWCRLQRDRPAFALERAARRLRQALR